MGHFNEGQIWGGGGGEGLGHWGHLGLGDPWIKGDDPSGYGG